ncbi:MAG: DUF808 domain-containing protein [Planctomycetota bacterium]|nr:DUF808 domain-containing protein [Planctomycetota bacterium]
MGASLFTLLDDVASLLDDVALMTKVAAKKTAGVLGDDLALNAEQVTGVRANRELPVVLAVFRGSLLNKAILVPTALVISAIAPWLVTPLLMLGGAYLCFEGFEKLAHRFLHSKHADEQRHIERVRALEDPAVDPVKFERRKIKGAIRTDFVLSAEIITITLGTVADEPLLQRCLVLVTIALGMTIGVYGLVAGIVKLDDLGLHLGLRPGAGVGARLTRSFGRGIVSFAPWLMKGLSVAGTVAMFLVGGGILVHGTGPLATWVHHLAEAGGLTGTLGPLLANAGVGLAAGALILAVVQGIGRLRSKPA